MRFVMRDADLLLHTLVEEIFSEVGFGDIRAANIFSPLNSFNMDDAKDSTFSAAYAIREKFTNTAPPRVVIRNGSSPIPITKDCYDEVNVVKSLNLKSDANMLPAQSLANMTQPEYSDDPRLILRSALDDYGHHVRATDASGAVIGPLYVCISKALVGWLHAANELGAFTMELTRIS